jgi:metal-dependent amidase/aminoacylase/carboxypeptidase family protein
MSDPTQDELNREAIRRGVRAHADQIKQKLFRWIVQNAAGPADAVPVSVALLEIAIEGHLVMTENESDTLDFVTKTFQRVAHKPKGRLQ